MQGDLGLDSNSKFHLEATETLTVVATADAAAVRHRRVVGGRGAVAPAAGGGGQRAGLDARQRNQDRMKWMDAAQSL